MRYLLDTNIVLLRMKSPTFKQVFDNLYANHTLAISVVTLGELESICVQNKWGTQKIQLLDAFTATLLKIDLNNAQMIRAYGKIDAYSQGKLNNSCLRLFLQIQLHYLIKLAPRNYFLRF